MHFLSRPWFIVHVTFFGGVVHGNILKQHKKHKSEHHLRNTRTCLYHLDICQLHMFWKAMDFPANQQKSWVTGASLTFIPRGTSCYSSIQQQKFLCRIYFEKITLGTKDTSSDTYRKRKKIGSQTGSAFGLPFFVNCTHYLEDHPTS